MQDLTAESVKPQSVCKESTEERVTHPEYVKTMG